jgi:hypothetical protein
MVIPLILYFLKRALKTMTAGHSEESPRRKTPEDEVLRDSSTGYKGRNLSDSSFASLRSIRQNDIFVRFSELS